MGTSVKLSLKPTKEIEELIGLDQKGIIHKFFTKRCADRMNRYVPKRTGTIGGSLRGTIDIQDDSITYEMPYASYQYFGIRRDGTRVVMNYSTPGTGCFWDDLMLTAEKNYLLKDVQEYVDRGGRLEKGTVIFH